MALPDAILPLLGEKMLIDNFGKQREASLSMERYIIGVQTNNREAYFLTRKKTLLSNLHVFSTQYQPDSYYVHIIIRMGERSHKDHVLGGTHRGSVHGIAARSASRNVSASG